MMFLMLPSVRRTFRKIPVHYFAAWMQKWMEMFDIFHKWQAC